MERRRMERRRLLLRALEEGLLTTEEYHRCKERLLLMEAALREAMDEGMDEGACPSAWRVQRSATCAAEQAKAGSPGQAAVRICSAADVCERVPSRS